MAIIMTEEICDNIPHKEHPEIVKFITERMSFFESLGKLSQKNDETGHTPEKLAEAIVKSNNIPEDKLKAAIADEVKRIKKMDQNGDRIVSMPEFLNSECKDHQESLSTPQVPMIKESPINGVMIRRM
jgi:hypothetical protein